MEKEKFFWRSERNYFIQQCQTYSFTLTNGLNTVMSNIFICPYKLFYSVMSNIFIWPWIKIHGARGPWLPNGYFICQGAPKPMHIPSQYEVFPERINFFCWCIKHRSTAQERNKCTDKCCCALLLWTLKIMKMGGIWIRPFYCWSWELWKFQLWFFL